VADCPAEHGDCAGVECSAAGVPRNTARCHLDNPSLPAEASPAGRTASPVERGVGSRPRGAPAARRMPTLRPIADRPGLVVIEGADRPAFRHASPVCLPDAT
jgi:hypothetical protein